MESPDGQARRRLLGSLRDGRERRAGRGVFPPCDLGSGSHRQEINWMPEQMIKVWDPIVRVLHWLLVALFVVAWQSPLRSDLIHEWSGYACVAVVLIRIAWGFVGTHHARFKSFLVSPRVAGLYIRSLLDMRPPRHIGHNPLGGWMIVALIAVMVVICVTGWMFTT
ncbi:MAG: hypothetical protein FJX59_18230, partial [Alphaproteobacteria bacterium]|nr:hypothetical protein [Alphaproteobacteria bacterium]